MPTLNWIGKDSVVRHHKEVPFRLLEPDKALSHGDPATGNLIVEGDNLHALKALLPRYAGKVKCIYIDPPYNTGNEGWIYNDNVNSPEILRWLGKTVGKEAEDLSRHDKWLCMMYPRLVLLKQFLTEDGAIFISIDDNEIATLRLLLDEIFGIRNSAAHLIWFKRISPANDSKLFSQDHDHVCCYTRDIERWKPRKLALNEEQQKNYSNIDHDPRGRWNSSAYTCAKTAEERPNLFYPIEQPNTGEEIWPRRTRVWAYDRGTHEKHLKEDLLYWGKDGLSKSPRLKKFLSSAKPAVPRTILGFKECGSNQEANLELREFGLETHFSTPKPSRLIQRLLQIATDKDSLVLDSFAGSGTTAHAVFKQNAEDGGCRRCILVEMEPNIARDITAERVRRVAGGYTNPKGDEVEGLGGGFQYCRLSAEPLFNATGAIREDVRFAQLAEFVWFAETGTGFTGKANSPLLGVHEGVAVYLLYNGILKDRSTGGGNVLTAPVLAELPPHKGPKVIYAAANRLGSPRLQRDRISFKQTPYALDF